MSPPGRVPRYLLRVLGGWLPADHAGDVVGDLEEAFGQRTRTMTPWRLRVWLWRQVFAFAGWLVLVRLTTRQSRRQRRRISRGTTMSGFTSDLRYAVRSFTRSPGFTVVTIATLALGVGANTAIFTVVNGVLWQPLAIPDSDRVVGVCESKNPLTDFCGASPPNVEDIRRSAATLEEVGVARTRSYLWRRDDGVEIVTGGIGTPEFLGAVGALPLLGRLPDRGDLPPGQHRVVTLSHRMWTNEFGQDSAVVGRLITFDDESYEIIGVMDPAVEPPLLGWVSMWLPLPFDPADEANRDWRGFWSVGRLRDGAGIREAAAELSTLAAGFAGDHPVANEDLTVRVVSLRDFLVRPVRRQLSVFLGASVLVLLIACVNVANLVLVRAGDRQKEFAVRSSLGADKRRLIRQLVTESLALALVGGGTGFWLGHAAVKWFVALAPPGIPRLDEIGLDARVVTFAVVVLAGTVVIFGLTPAVRATRVDVTTAMKEGSRGGGTKRGGRVALVISEVALALMLLTGAGLLMRSFATAARWRPGFDYENLATLWLLGSSTKYTEGRQVVRVFHDVVDVVEALPDVRAAGTASAGPLFGGREPGEFIIAGRPAPAPDERPRARWFDIGPQYFQTIGLPVVRGRAFTPADDESAPRVAMINEAMARRYWPDEDPLGHFVEPVLGWTSEAAPMQIVGIVQDVTPFDPNVPAEPEIYWPNLQSPRLATYLVIRTVGTPDAVLQAVRDRIEAVDPSMSVGRATTIEAMMGSQLVRPRFQMLLLGVFAVVALALATVGTYGVVSYGVSGRTHEFGLRMSLGARRRDILRLVITEGTRIGGVGIVVGVAGGLAVTRVMASMLIGVAPRDVLTFAAAPSAMALAVVLACYLPARRAARIHPMVAMRTE